MAIFLYSFKKTYRNSIFNKRLTKKYPMESSGKIVRSPANTSSKAAHG